MSLIELEFDPKLHVAGEEVTGTVLLNFKELQKMSLEEIHVKLRGSVFTYVSVQSSLRHSDADITLVYHRHSERKELIEERIQRSKVDLIR